MKPLDCEPSDCEQTLLRQFDSDCAPGKPTPDDVAAHLAACDSCRQEWQLARGFDARLRAEMAVDVPAELYRKAYHAAIIAPENEAKPIQRTFRLLFAGLLGIGAAAGTLVVPYLSEWSWLAPVVFITVTVAAYLIEIVDEGKTPAL